VGVLVVLTIGLIWWLIAWSFGIKAFDAFLLTVVMVVVAAAVRIALPFVNQLLGRTSASPSERRAR
jgi:hypothetical protein